MIEQGIVALVQGTPAVKAIAATGGFLMELPKDSVLPSWTYGRVSFVPNNTLTSFNGLKMLRLQIDCYGDPNGRGVDTINLAKAIDTVLNGFHGTLSDPDATFINECFTSDTIDFFDEERRSYRRMLEYEIHFAN